MLEKLHCDYTERELLGKLIIDPDSFSRLDKLQTKHFYSKINQVIYSGIESINNSGQTPDLITVSDYLRKSGDLESIGGTYYLSGLVENIISSVTIKQDENRLIDYWQRREIYCGLSRLINQVDSYELSSIEADVFSLLENVEADKGVGFQKLSAVASKFLTEYMSGCNSQLKTDFIDLDNLFGGFKSGDLMYLAGATSSGKTALALGISYHLINKQIPVGYISLEMSGLQLFRRLVLETGLDAENATKKLAELPLYIDDSGEGNIGRILSRANLLIKRHKIQLLILDHLQLTSGKGETRNQELTAISGALKRFAVKNKIAVLGLSQLNRKGSDDIPKLEHLRDSGALEADADYVLLLYRPRRAESKIEQNTAYLDLGKNRHGGTGQFRLTFLEGVFKNYISKEL